MTMITTTAGRGFTRIAAFLLLVAAVVLVAECRTIREDQLHLKYQQKRAAQDNEPSNQFQADGSTDGEDDGTSVNVPVILSDSMKIDATEGSTAQLPCKVTQGSLDEFTLLWINGTKTIMTDGDPATTNTRVTQAKSPLSKTLSIEGVTRWDSGTYTCKITSEPPVEITHTLRVLHPAKITSLKVIGAEESTSSGGQVKKFVVKQGEPVQFICKVDGNPEPKVQWIKRMNHQQMLLNTQSQGLDQSLVSPQQLPTTTVSNTNEFKIESVNALHDAGHYECVAQNKQGADPPISMEMELVIDYPPTITVRQPIVNTGETYTAQLVCTVHAYPKVKVTWEKEQTNADGSSSYVQLSTDSPGTRYETFRPKDIVGQGSENVSMVPAGHNHGLKVRRVQGPKDFGKYRCKAENKLGHAYSDDITLTGTPASPQQSYVHMKSGLPELGWNVDSWSPVLEYQLQFRRQQDPATSWYDVRPQPMVVNPSSDPKTFDERRYAVSYVFGEDSKQEQSLGGSTYVPLSLQRGTTYVAHIRAKNEHGWSDWSPNAVFSGVDFNEGSNEINQNGVGDSTDVSKASVGGGTSGASRVQQLQYCGVTVLAITLAVVSNC